MDWELKKITLDPPWLRKEIEDQKRIRKINSMVHERTGMVFVNGKWIDPGDLRFKKEMVNNDRIRRHSADNTKW